MSSTGTKPQLEQTPVAKPEDQLFALEAELEESGVSFRLIAIIAIVVAIALGIGYYLVHGQRDLNAADATPIVTASLQARGPAVMSFRIGHVEPSVFVKPRDPHYKLLENAGIIAVKDDKQGGIFATMTGDGALLVSNLPGFKKVKNTDGTETYIVPLAARVFVSVDKVTMNGPNAATVDYSWKWKPNVLGQKFDAGGDMVHKFNTWERATLIKEYGVDFFTDPQKTSASMIRGENGWTIAEP